MKKSIMVFFICVSLVKDMLAGTFAADSIPVNQKDVESVNAIINSLYNVISGSAGEKRDWDRMKTLFIAEARLMATGKRQDGSMGKRVMTVEEYITNSGPVLEKDGFFESEIGRKTEQFGGVVHVFSTYGSKRKLEDAQPFMRGINSIQLWNDGKRWWVVSVFWQSESPDNPIPEKYLD